MSTEQPENKAVSTALDFKKKREARDSGDILTLQSGLTVRLRRPEISKLIARGFIPAQLVQRFMNLKPETSKGNIKPEDIEALLELQTLTTKYALLEPKIVDEPNYENNEISIEDLDTEDIEEIWAYANGGVEEVAKFRQERNAGVLSGLDSDTLPEQTT